MQLKVDRALAVPGWMSLYELGWLAEQASQRYRIAEIGSYQGRSTVALGENTKGVVFAIDTWKGSAEHTPEQIGPEGLLFQHFINNTKGLPILPVQSTSLDAAKHFQTCGFKLFDMIFIDASHAPEDVRADILAWRELLQPGGILCGHDFGTWSGLAETVIDVLGDVKVPIGSIWLKDDL